MRIGNFDRRLGRSIFSFVLVGSLMTCVVTSQYNEDIRNTATSIACGHYTNEDVKKNSEEIMMMIADGGSSKVKTYGKKKEIVPKTITK